MEKQLKCVPLLSLKEMALRRVAVLLCSGSDALASISKFQYEGFLTTESKTEWLETIEPKIKDKALKLELPKLLTREIFDIIYPVGLRIKRWKYSHELFSPALSEEASLLDSAKLFWTTAGLINYRKTAEELVRCDVLDVVQRYKLACINCLEDYVPLLWDKLPEEKKDYFNNKVLYKKPTSPCLHFCWPHILKDELSTLDYLLRASDRNLTTFNQWAFEDSAVNGNKTAAEYFFQKLTNEERETSLIRTALAVLEDSYAEDFLTERVSDILCYLLSLMTPGQQLETIKAHPIDVFLCLFYWSLQDLFLENAGLIWTFISPSGYSELVSKIIHKYKYSSFNFPEMFQIFLMQCPLGFKKFFVDQECAFSSPACRFLCMFLRSEDSQSIEVIFRNVDAADRVELVLHHCVLQLFYKSIMMDRWHLVEVCLREATLSQEDREKLKKAFMGRNDLGCEKFKGFFEFLDETDASADERKKGQKRRLEYC